MNRFTSHILILIEDETAKSLTAQKETTELE